MTQIVSAIDLKIVWAGIQFIPDNTPSPGIKEW